MAASLTSVVVSFLLFLLGVITPWVLMNLAYGAQAVHDSPAHGGALFIFTVPLAALISLIFLFGFIVYFYEKWGG
jgi:hypothetical protein